MQYNIGDKISLKYEDPYYYIIPYQEYNNNDEDSYNDEILNGIITCINTSSKYIKTSFKFKDTDDINFSTYI